ncbi:MAG: NAD(P)/FAD-dependent oxidoreductase [Lachnospiraceae bacterium]
MEEKQVVIIGGGPAGLAAAVELFEQGIRDILIIERELSLGGILRQCIHDGFGLARLKETLSGPEYAQRFVDQVIERKIPFCTNTTVIDISNDKIITASSAEGIIQYQAEAVVLAMGCRERTRHALSIPGTRPAGVYTAGVAQSYVNLQNIMPGKEVVILGSGDIGMIMARRMTLEGAHVLGVFEIQPYPSGLPRNIRQCLDDYGIPLHLSHTVVDIHGQARLEGVTIAQVNEQFEPIPGTEVKYPCDTLILSVGLIPENELSLSAGVALDERTKGALVDENYQTSVPGIFAAGNVLHVHDLVDYVSMEGERLAKAAVRYLHGRSDQNHARILVVPDKVIGYTVPQTLSGEQDFVLSMRVRRPLKNCTINLLADGRCIKTVKMKKALPAEMIQIPLTADAVNGADRVEVKIQC